VEWLKSASDAVVAFFTAEGMAGNLASELIGIVVTLIFVSWLGGAFVRRSLDQSFMRKWKLYRVHIADTLYQVDDRLRAGMIYLGTDMRQIAEKSGDAMTSTDLDEYRRDYDLVLADVDYLVNFMHRHHFALQDGDIAAVSEYISFISEKVESIFRRELSFRNFEGMLSTHFQGRYRLEMPVLRDGALTRHDVLRASAEDAAKKLSAVEIAAWVDKREAVLACLRS
jgi:hypothetical protein